MSVLPLLKYFFLNVGVISFLFFISLGCRWAAAQRIEFWTTEIIIFAFVNSIYQFISLTFFGTGSILQKTIPGINSPLWIAGVKAFVSLTLLLVAVRVYSSMQKSLDETILAYTDKLMEADTNADKEQLTRNRKLITDVRTSALKFIRPQIFRVKKESDKSKERGVLITLFRHAGIPQEQLDSNHLLLSPESRTAYKKGIWILTTISGFVGIVPV